MELNKKNSKLQNRKELARTFLLYNFSKLSNSKKEKFFNKQIPEVIFRTMKLEGENISAGDVKKILKSNK